MLKSFIIEDILSKGLPSHEKDIIQVIQNNMPMHVCISTNSCTISCSRCLRQDIPLHTRASSSFKLNTYVEIKGYDTTSNRKLLTEALNLCDRYEMIFSRTLPDSELSRLNRHEITTVSARLGEVTSYSMDYGRLPGGSSDISTGSVSSLWDFTSGNPSVPDTSRYVAGALYDM